VVLVIPNQRRWHEILEHGRKGDHTATWANRVLMGLVLVNIMAVIVESEHTIYLAYQVWFDAVEFLSVTVFALEYGLRVWTAALNTDAGPTPAQRRWRYVFSLYGLVDLIAIVPSMLAYFLPTMDLRSLRAIRLLRILKFTHYSYALQDLWQAIYVERRAFTASLYVLGVAIILSSTLMYLAEHQAQPEKFASIPRAMWWSIITLTTVGYGDVMPITPLGQFLGALVAIMGVCTVALITGILASSFAVQMERRNAAFEEQVSQALADGVITPQEMAFLETLQEDLGVSDEEFEALRGKILRKRQEQTQARQSQADAQL
jgi:voltage-gated potassium channel